MEYVSVSSLPLPLTPLIGREHACQSVSDLLLRQQVRLLTLTGAPGVGKTRLALATARELCSSFADGVCFLSLAALREPGGLLLTIAEALRLQGQRLSLLHLLQTALRERHLLLVLDNFEHLLPAAAQMSTLLEACPSLTLLVTSRERLHLPGEVEYLVPPLALPDLSHLPDEEALAHTPAVALFLAHAHMIRPEHALTGDQLQTVAQICVRLDGLPLALELAARRLRLFSPSALLARLSSPLNVLTGERSDTPVHQRTLHATLQWSYDLLSEAEQRLFRRLCCFVGGATLDLLEELYEGLGENQGVVLDGLSGLLDKSLIQREGADQDEGVPRLRVLEPIREFGLHLAQTLGEQKAVLRGQAHLYLHRAQAGRSALFGPDQRRWLRWFREESPNLRAVLAGSIEQQEQDLALGLAATLGTFWLILGSTSQQAYVSEGVQMLTHALRGSQRWPTVARGLALVLLAGLLAQQGESEAAEQACQQGVILCRDHHEVQGQVEAMWMLKDVYELRGDYRAAACACEEAVRLCREHPERLTTWGAPWTLGYSLNRAATIALWQGHYQQARALLVEGTTLCRQAGDHYAQCLASLSLAEVACFQGQRKEARSRLQDCLATLQDWQMHKYVAETLGFMGLLAAYEDQMEEAVERLGAARVEAETVGDGLRHIVATLWLANVRLLRGEVEQARHGLDEALPLALRLHRLPTVIGLETLAAVMAAQGEPTGAAQLWGAAAALREVMGAPLPALQRSTYDTQIAAVRRALGAQRFHMAWSLGHALTAEQALRVSQEGASRVWASSRSRQADAWDLTAREVEVLLLLGEGQSNAQIAQQLALAPVTINAHLRSIYRKLGVSSRTQALREAHEHHLF